MKNILIKLIIIFFFILIFINKDIMYYTIYNTTILWFKNIVPNLLPMFIISSLIIESNLIFNICNIFGKLFSKIFNTSIYGIFVFLLSIFTGSPSNAKYINDLYNQGLITNNECNKLLVFTSNFNPLLIYSLLSLYLNSYSSIRIIIILIITNIIIGLLNRNMKIDILPVKNIHKNINLSNIIKNTMDILFMILGTLIFFNLIINMIPIKDEIISNILNGCLEITTALKTLSTINISVNIKEILSLIYLSFGGLSIHMQIKSILPDTNYKMFFKYKILSIFISLLLLILIR